MLITRISRTILGNNLEQLSKDGFHFWRASLEAQNHGLEHAQVIRLLVIAICENVEDLQDVNVVGEIFFFACLNSFRHFFQELAIA